MAYDYDLFTIGGGSGGVRASRFAANLGARVAVAEAGPFGGTCVNVGCVPKKLMSIAAHFHEDQRDAVGFGWEASAPRFDWATLIARKDREIARLNEVYVNTLAKAGVTILRGWCRLVDAHTVEVDGQRYTAQNILVATGGEPTRATLPGAELAITSDDFFFLPEQPRRALVYGGGYIAVEMASIFNGLGTETTLMYRGDRLLRGFDADLGTHLAGEMGKKGMRLALHSTIESLSRTPTGIHAQLADGSHVEADCVLFATGRRPRVANLGLEAAGVALSADGAVLVDEQLRSNVPSIYAIGDVIDRVALTPVALSEGMVVAEALFGKSGRRTPYELIATAVFSHPNVASVGLGEEDARSRGHDVAIYRSVFTPLRHTLSDSGEKALMKLVVDRATDRVLGVHLVAPEAGEVLQGFAVALGCGATKAQFDATIGIHPTLAEEFVTMRQAV
jgi:glutathione reductase (NADPH)